MFLCAAISYISGHGEHLGIGELGTARLWRLVGTRRDGGIQRRRGGIGRERSVTRRRQSSAIVDAGDFAARGGSVPRLDPCDGAQEKTRRVEKW